MIHVYDFEDYKAFLRALEAQRVTVQRGFRSRLAETLGCQSAYISQILNGEAHFSLEQGLKVAGFLQLGVAETRYLLLMIEWARAGTEELKKFFLQDLRQLREQFLNLKGQLSEARAIPLESQTTYYSDWVYSAIHVLVTIPQFRTLAAISRALNLPESVAKDALLFLLSVGLIAEHKGQFAPGPTQIHLDPESPNIRQHHIGWRLAAARSLTQRDKSAVHYSTVSSLSLHDAEKFRTRFLEMIMHYVKSVGPSKEEVLYNFNLDFYSLIPGE